MARLNNSLINDNQSRTLSQRVDTLTNTVDLNYNGYSTLNINDSFEKYGVYSHINRVLLWLASKPHDFVRSSLKGGILYSLLGTLQKDSVAQEWEEIIMERFNENFSGELSMLTCKVTFDKQRRKVTVSVVVKDNVNQSVFSLNVEVEK